MENKGDFTFYWSIVKWPTLIIMIAEAVRKLVRTQEYLLFELFLVLLLLLNTGNIVHQKKQHMITAAWAGATCGILFGFGFAIIDIIAYLINPLLLDPTNITVLISNIVLVPVVYAIFSGTVSLVGAFIAKLVFRLVGKTDNNGLGEKGSDNKENKTKSKTGNR